MPAIDLPHIIIWSVLGLIAGSFLATLVIRWPEDRSVLRGRSLCDGCGTPIPARALVPLLSFALQSGRARCCGRPIDRVHPLMELGCAGIGLASALVLREGTAFAALFGWLLLTLAVIDARHMWLPDPLVAAVAVLGLLSALAFPAPVMLDRVAGLAGGYLGLARVAWLYRKLRGRDGLGGGDPKLLGAIGAWTGLALLPSVLLVAALAGLGYAVVQRLRGAEIGPATPIAFGTLLGIAAWPLWLAILWHIAPISR